jgi:hypothetical protein
MTMNNLSLDHPRTPVTRQPYEKPSFRYEKVFVTTALACSKIGTSSLSCASSAKVS